MARFQLQLLLDHARHRLEAAERLLRMLRRKQEAADQRLEELRQYRQEYRQRYTGSGAAGMDIHLLRDFQLFMAKLDQAIRHQEGEVVQCQASWQAGHEKWLAQRQKVKAYEILEERHANSETQRIERQEQRVSDERSTRRHAVRVLKSFT